MKVPKYFVVPWRNPEQFQKVAKCLYSPSITDKRWAVDQISVWESRCHPALPTAIDATVGLVRAVIQDLLFEVEKSFCQAKDIQMFYAMALVRFVNLTLEIDQSFKKVQLATLAEKRNIPKWLIDLRHEAVHTYCPSLPVLRMGAQTALTYLDDTFWKVESTNIQSIVKTPSSNNQEIMDLITRYRNIQHCRHEKNGNGNELCTDLKAVLKKLCGHIDDSKEELIDALLLPGVFLCTEDLVKLLQASASTYLEFEDDLALPPTLEWFWLPMLRLLLRYNLIHRFLEKLLLNQEHCNVKLCQKIAAAWATRLFLATSSHSSDKTLDKCFKEKGVLFSLTRLLYACMIGLNKYLIHFMDMVTQRMGYREEYRELYCIAALRQGMFVEKSSPDAPPVLTKTPTKRSSDTLSEIIFTLGDVEDDLKELRTRKKRPRRDDNIWSEVPATYSMANIPLGAVLNPVKIEESVKEEAQPATPLETPTEERFIFVNEKEEITVEEKDTSDNWLKTFRPEQFDMVYRRRQKN